ncbi:MAG: leucine-rich repeat protein [Spirochaetaceae bacterium]|jgi:hypothetical protein|nr:leucine-rich repeat protein [Spirochaetaceae bacterium]
MKKYLLGILGGAVLSCLIPACSMPAEPSAEPAGFGQVRISFASGPARTVIPAKTFERYVYQFTGVARDGITPSKKYDSAGDEISTNGNNPVVSLEAGDWTVTVYAYVLASQANNDSTHAQAAASGTSAIFTVTAGAVTPVTVELTGEAAAGNGTFKYNIQYPAGVYISANAFTMTSLPTPGSSVLISPPWGGTAVTGAESSVPAGFYLVKVELTWNGRKAGKTEVVHIYQNMTTEWGTADAPIRFDPADFARQPLPSGANAPTADITLYDGSQISGALQVGDIIKAVPDTSSTPSGFNGGSVTYQWYRSDNAPSNPLSASPNTFQISGATDSIYVVDPADRGKYISVEVTWDNYISSVFGTTTLPVKAIFTNPADLETWLSALTDTTPTYEVAFTGLDIGTLSLTDADLSGRNVSIDLSGLTGNSIAANAFNGCTALTEITLPASLQTIGANAFNSCTTLTTVICLAVTPPTLAGSAVFPTSVTSIKVPASTSVPPGNDGPIIFEYKAQWSAYTTIITELQ